MRPLPRHRRPAWTLGASLTVVLAVTLTWWIVGRMTADSRRLTVHVSPGAPGSVAGGLDTPAVVGDRNPSPGWGEREGVLSSREPVPAPSLKILTWNIAHGRGDVSQGWLNNWEGGDEEERIVRLMAIARVIRETEADVVVLNEVDFDSQWSGSLNQARILAGGAGYPTWVEQRNYDIQLPILHYAFGNALLTRLPVLEARWVAIPPHSGLESVAIGAKSSSVVRLQTSSGWLEIIPVHMEVRDRKTRLGAAFPFDSVRRAEAHPLILAGDFNSAPSGWPDTEDGTTLVDSLLSLGWTSPRARGAPADSSFTFPTPALRDARDWILVEPPLKILSVRILHGADGLSDHAPVLAEVALPASETR